MNSPPPEVPVGTTSTPAKGLEDSGPTRTASKARLEAGVGGGSRGVPRGGDTEHVRPWTPSPAPPGPRAGPPTPESAAAIGGKFGHRGAIGLSARPLPPGSFQAPGRVGGWQARAVGAARGWGQRPGCSRRAPACPRAPCRPRRCSARFASASWPRPPAPATRRTAAAGGAGTSPTGTPRGPTPWDSARPLEGGWKMCRQPFGMGALRPGTESLPSPPPAESQNAGPQFPSPQSGRSC